MDFKVRTIVNVLKNTTVLIIFLIFLYRINTIIVLPKILGVFFSSKILLKFLKVLKILFSFKEHVRTVKMQEMLMVPPSKVIMKLRLQ